MSQELPEKSDTRYRQRWSGAYLAALEITGKYNASAKAADISIGCIQRERHLNPDFLVAEKEAMGVAMHMLHDEALRRAVQGTRRLKFTADGRVMVDPRRVRRLEDGTPDPTQDPNDYVYEEVEYSDALLAKMLAAHRPEHRNQLKVESENTNVNIEAGQEQISPERLAELQLLRREALEEDAS